MKLSYTVAQVAVLCLLKVCALGTDELEVQQSLQLIKKNENFLLLVIGFSLPECLRVGRVCWGIDTTC